MAPPVKTQSKKNKILIEYMKCKNDFEHYCKNYVKIEIPGADLLLKPYKKQMDLIKSIQKYNFVLSLKSRQVGISTIVQAYASWLAVFHKNVVIGIVSKDAPEATDFARAIMGMIDKLPKFMTPKFKKRTERTFILDNGSKCYASPVAPNAPDKTLRGKGVTFLVIDEAAFIKFVDVAWTAMVPALSTSQKHARTNNVPYGTVLLSTPNKTMGTGKWFYQKYCDSIEEINAFKSEIIYWKDIPELLEDPDWYETTCKLLDYNQQKIDQELELKFLPSVGSFFDAKVNSKLQDDDYKPIEILKLFNGEIWKFSDPEPGKFYILGVDTATAYGHDNSTIVIFDYETLEQVWEFRGKLKVEDFCKIVKLACYQYQGCVVIENNSVGNQVMESIDSSEYSFMMYKERRKVKGSKGQPNGVKLIPGLSTNSRTRPLMIDSLYTYVNEFTETIKSKRLQLELIGLVEKSSGRVEADEGGYDDLALAASMAYFVRKYDPPKMIEFQQKEEYSSDIRDIVEMNDILAPGADIAHIKKHIKNNLLNDENFNGIVDIFNINRG